MSDAVRYEILEEIARGDFATVYRGRDAQLGREVAIKQLHQQYLNSPKLTERYWQEAQLLARLEHPHVMTIYDVVPQRGWLILELMKGSLKDKLGGRAINLSDLRLTILYVARALAFFQQQHILHGDVKPSNLLIDRNNGIKLGDFGIARRLQNDEGSAIKGTTRYIAPEVVSDKFGPVGPHSDIYSLGFSAYELLCGERFETLFPGLHMFGRDQQLAWMMWHSAADRRLPKIQEVLEGVPDKLAVVIERMTEKNPARRYRSAEQVIADLSSKSLTSVLDTSAAEEEAAAQAARQARRKRWLSVAALAVSVLLSTAMLIPWGKEPPRPVVVAPTRGVVGKVDSDRSKIFLTSDEVLTVEPDDLILLNGAVCQLADLQPNDALDIKYLKGAEGQTKRIQAARGEQSRFAGPIVKIDTDQNLLTVGDGADEDLRQFCFDGETLVSLNGQSVTLAHLLPGDSVVVQYRDQDVRTPAESPEPRADSLKARRRLAATGVLESFDVARRQLTFHTDQGDVTLPLADDCAIQLNGRTDLAGRKLTLADLQNGDRIVILHYDERLLDIELQRDLSDIVEVWAVDVPGRRLSVVVNGETVDCMVGDAPIEFQGRPVDLAFLRKGDRLVVAHDAPDFRNMTARSIEVSDLVRDPRLSGLVICQQKTDTAQITPYKYAADDAEWVREALETGARVPEDQLAVLSDLDREQLKQGIDKFLAVQRNRNRLLVYVVAQVYLDLKSGEPYLAARDFRLNNVAETGFKLRDLLQILEAFQAREKILVLDTCHDVSATEAQAQPSAEEQIRKLMVNDAVSTSVLVIGSCAAGQRASADNERGHGQLALRLAAALRGGADQDADAQVTAAELFPYLATQLASVKQTPVQFLPDTHPRRLDPEAAKAVRRLLVDLSRFRPSKEFDATYAEAQRLCGNQPDAQLAYGVVKLKAGRTGDSYDAFLAVLAEHPDALVAYHGIAYQMLVRQNWEASAENLVRLLQRLAIRQKERHPYIDQLLQMAGIARELIAAAAPDTKLAQSLDEAAAKLDPDEQQQYQQGRAVFAEQVAQIPADQQTQLRRYYKFDFELVGKYLADQLDQ